MVFDDFFGEVGGFGEVVEVGEAVVLEPEKIEARLVPRREFGVLELAPASLGIFLRVPGFLALQAVIRVVAVDKVG